MPNNKYDLLIKDADTQRVRLINGKPKCVKTKQIVGFCHYNIHPGYLTKKLLVQQKCIEKNCMYLERFKSTAFWQHHYKEQAKANERKRSKKQRRSERQSNDAVLQLMHRQAQEYANSLKLDIIITNIEYIDGKYFVFYLSDMLRDDSYYYTSVTWKLKTIYPDKRFIMKHIKKDGKYMPKSALNGGH